jgi:hypothetical protein
MLYHLEEYRSGPGLARYFVEPPFRFAYAGFGWVEPLPLAGMQALVRSTRTTPTSSACSPA